MKLEDLQYLSFAELFSKGVPVYVLGATAQISQKIIQMIDKDGYKLAGIWDENWLLIKKSEQYEKLYQWYQNKGYEVSPIPININMLEKCIVIVAMQGKYQRDWMDYCARSSQDVYDGYDVLLYKAYCNCLEGNCNTESLLEKCRTCRASWRSCPIRREYYEKQKNESRNKVLRHLAMKVGYICNLKCKYCSEYLPRFTSEQRKMMDLQGCLADINKLSMATEYINTLSLSGGDAMLNRELAELIEEVVKIDNIGDIYILTNGTYVPHKDILNALERHRDRVRIVVNNYSVNNGAEELLSEFGARNINFEIRKNLGWYDLTDTSFRNYSVHKLRELYENCSFDKTEGYYYIIIGGKLSMRCGVANSMLYYLNKFDECIEDYIDVRQLSAENIPEALSRLEDKGYLDICNYCSGCQESERTYVPAGEQL